MNNLHAPRAQGLAQAQQHSTAYIAVSLAQGFMLTLSLFLLLSLGL